MSEDCLGWAQPCVPVRGVVVGAEGPLEVFCVKAAGGGHVLPEHPLGALDPEFATLVEVWRADAVHFRPLYEVISTLMPRVVWSVLVAGMIPWAHSFSPMP